MNLKRYNQNVPDSNLGLVPGAPASRRHVDDRKAGGTPALPGNALRFWDVSRRLRTAAGLAVLGAFLANGRPAAAQTTNAPAVANFSSFQIVVDRNIFNPNRYARTSRGHSRSTSPSAPWFSLVGTLSSRQGMLAFFNGNDADYRKVLSPDGVIAGYKVAEITLHGVKLISTNKPVVMNVGAQMRQEGKGEWQLAESGDLPATTGSEAPAADETSVTNPASGSAGEPNDILKKLMQQREQELK